ncbi:hypothetical protein GVO57_06225 [Sphingomonas changnyeongensis]|uniref:Ferric uptake regulation protein n=1 Tax=Sphingomonas changnyeongensis TaxID=2698679 RepID=A0A7Z2S4X2_9SPHN|nr:hypothetical protein [Sphingomonas changnyeongensis]QHL90510.1 hypothetical protein GVO57_06225 [Sphingomonas changnyeongensis]
MMQRDQGRAAARVRSERLSRTLVLDLLAERQAPMGAYALRDALIARLGRSVSPYSVYRIIRALEGEGRLRRVESSRGWMCADPATAGDLMLLCTGCRAIQPVSSPFEAGRLLDLGRAHGFARMRLVLEVMGLCVTCQAARASGR